MSYNHLYFEFQHLRSRIFSNGFSSNCCSVDDSYTSLREEILDLLLDIQKLRNRIIIYMSQNRELLVSNGYVNEELTNMLDMTYEYMIEQNNHLTNIEELLWALSSQESED